MDTAVAKQELNAAIAINVFKLRLIGATPFLQVWSPYIGPSYHEGFASAGWWIDTGEALIPKIGERVPIVRPVPDYAGDPAADYSVLWEIRRDTWSVEVHKAFAVALENIWLERKRESDPWHVFTCHGLMYAVGDYSQAAYVATTTQNKGAP